MVRKILFFVFIFFLFLFSTTKTQAVGACTITAVPGPDFVTGKDGILTSHTHNATLSIKSDGLFNDAKYPKGGYLISLGLPPKLSLLDNDDDSVYNQLSWPVTESTYPTKSNSGADLWNIGEVFTCGTPDSGCTQILKIPNMDGAGESRDPSDPTNNGGYSSYMGWPFMPGTYTVSVYSVAAQKGSSPVCTGSFSVDPSTLDYGYDHCKIDVPTNDKLNISTDLNIVPHIWGKGDGDTVHIELVSLDGAIHSLGQDVKVGDVNNKSFDMGKPPLAQGYYVAINWGGGVPLGWMNAQHECLHGPITIGTAGGVGGGGSGEGVPCNTTGATDTVGNCPAGFTCIGPRDTDQKITNGICSDIRSLYNGHGSLTFNDYSVMPTPVCPNNVCETAIGNINTSPEGFIQVIMGFVLSIAGGIAIILIIISGYRLMVSQGNPENIKNAKDQLTAAIIGLLFIIFSLVVLQIIGFNILGLPGFNQ